MSFGEYGVYLLAGCKDWMDSLQDKEYRGLAARIDLLAEQGPVLGRPIVDSIKGSRHANLKEIRYSKLRLLFAFDPDANAVLVIGGSKEDRWTEWYDENIPIADDLYDDWLDNLKRTPGWLDVPDTL
jgi:hypothetical protein